MPGGLHLLLPWLLAVLGCDGPGPAVAPPPLALPTPGPSLEDLAEADGTWRGAGAGDWAGRQVAPAGDIDGDGLADVVLTALWHDAAAVDAGAVYLLRGPATPGATLDEAHAVLLGEGAHDAAGVSATGAGDVDGDGFADLVIGADGHDLPRSNAGVAYVVFGPIVGVHSLAEADAKLYGEGRGDLAGVSVAGAGDTNGDGFDDLLVGARYHDQAGVDAGAAYLVRGPPLGSASLGTADAKLLGEAPGDWAGITVAPAGDVDGDGLADLAVGAVYEDAGGADAGAVYLVRGPVAGVASLAQADAKLVGEAALDEAARIGGGGDADGDGLADLWVGAARHDGGGLDAGAAYLVRGPPAGVTSLGESHTRLIGEAPGNETAFRLAFAGDVDGDGHDDAIIGAWLDDYAGPDAGACYLVLDPPAGTHPVAEAAARIWRGAAAGDRLCSSAAGADLDADGLADLLLTAPQRDDGGEDAGGLYVVLGASLD
jgi:hypothetical protein